ncbi:hypothetical protein E1A91_A05G064400v1 [Gossypium mustelinum]|uniref:Uncharacterized protein n=1 Tax=Gossypium mustelinum TaxID=34275 RepID=A0A5D2Z3Q1_GOSMU|nr:hypothetical protein E1A91_A05G064400v1 [Gossypium mustelinum]
MGGLEAAVFSYFDISNKELEASASKGKEKVIED